MSITISDTYTAHGLDPKPGPYRLDDYFQLTEGEPCELILGRFYVSPSPGVRHQVVVAILLEVLSQFSRASGGLAFVGPLDVVLSERTVVQPDLLYVGPERRQIIRDRIEGAPDLVVEVLSPGTVRRDRTAKLQSYAESGVREYWIVDTAAHSVEFLINQQRRFTVEVPQGETYQSPAIAGLTLDQPALWNELARRLG